MLQLINNGALSLPLLQTTLPFSLPNESVDLSTSFGAQNCLVSLNYSTDDRFSVGLSMALLCTNTRMNIFLSSLIQEHTQA